ncbi:MAG: N-acetylmuramoyl-L-alanine amidase [Spirochaetaceae bacterium]|nr:N-acetylmuramoyl-L-alanine amidase [Spirochaetaceae bacterium]
MKKLNRLFGIFIFCSMSLFVNAQSASFVPLIEGANQIGAKLFWDSLSGIGVLEKDGHSMQFKTEDQIALFDYRTFEIVDAPKVVNGSVFVSNNFMSRAEDFLGNSKPAAPDSLFKIGAILIDPGHGGKDTGAIGKHTVNGKTVQIYEKDVVLKIAEDLYKQLKTAYSDKKIYMTRNDDTFLSLEERVEIANNTQLGEHEAILYISIHANSAFDKKASGFEVWYLSPGYRRTILSEDAADKEILPILNSMLEEEFTTESILIAKFILDSLNTEIGKESPNRGLKEEEWFVVRNANMPSVLIEVGFVSNQKEALLLADDKYLHKVASGIYNGLASFITHFEQSRGFTSGQ